MICTSQPTKIAHHYATQPSPASTQSQICVRHSEAPRCGIVHQFTWVSVLDTMSDIATVCNAIVGTSCTVSVRLFDILCSTLVFRLISFVLRPFLRCKWQQHPVGRYRHLLFHGIWGLTQCWDCTSCFCTILCKSVSACFVWSIKTAEPICHTAAAHPQALNAISLQLQAMLLAHSGTCCRCLCCFSGRSALASYL